MTRIFAAELHKVWNNKFFLIALSALLSINVFLLWFGTAQTSNSIPSSAYRTITLSMKGLSMDEKADFLKNELLRTEGLLHIDYVLRTEAENGGRIESAYRQQYKLDFEEWYEIYQTGDYLRYCTSLSREYLFIKGIFLEFSQVNEYEDFLKDIQTQAENLSAISIFQSNSNKYSNANITATASAFTDMDNIMINYYPQKGLIAALNFELTDVVVFFIMLLISTVLVRAEKDNGLLALICATSAGRMKTAIIKIISFAICMGLSVFALYSINLLYCGTFYGLGDLSRSIQSVPALMRSTFKVDVATYLIFFYFTKWVTAFICGSWVMFAMIVTKRLLGGITAAISFFALNLLIRAIIPATSYMNVLKYANLVSLLRTNELLGGYRNLYWFSSPLPIVFIEGFAAVSFATISISGFILYFANAHWGEKPRRKLLHVVPLRPGLKYVTPLRTEIFKFGVLQGGFLIVLVFAFVQISTAISTASVIDVDEIYYQNYMRQIEGTYSQANYKWLREQGEEFNPIFELEYNYSHGKITEQEYQTLLGTYSSLLRKMNVFQRVTDKLPQLKEKQRMQLVYETGWLQLFDYQDKRDITDSLAVSLICVLCLSGLVAIEKQTGIIKVIAPTPLGQQYTVRTKFAVALALSVFLSVLSVLPAFWVAVRDYGLGTWLAPVYSITEYGNALEIPLFLMVGVMMLHRVTAIIFVACCVLAISQLTGNTFGTIFTSGLVFGLPQVLCLAGLKDAKWFSIYLPFHITALIGTAGSMVLAFLLPLLHLIMAYGCFLYVNTRFGK